jgi:hypothetical protein
MVIVNTKTVTAGYSAIECKPLFGRRRVRFYQYGVLVFERKYRKREDSSKAMSDWCIFGIFPSRG